MEVAEAAETNGSTTTSSFLQRFHKVSSIFYLSKLRDVATSLSGGLWGGAFRIQKEQKEEEAVVEDDLEAGAPEAEEETNGATTSSFLQHLRVVSTKLRDAATSLAGGLWEGAFGIQEEEEEAVVKDDLEAGAPKAEENNVRNSIGEKSLVIMPTFPATLCFTLPGLFSLAQIKWQLAPSGFPSPTLHKWYIVCVTSLLTEFLASIAQWIISAAAAGP